MTPQIIGGVPATETYSFMASMQSIGGGHRCGASLIAATWVVSARHCVGGSPASLQFRIGTTNRNAGGSVIRATRIVRHQSSDLALIQLASAAPQQPIAIASSAPVGNPLRLLGWGATRDPGGGAPVVLQQLDTSVVADSRCRGIRGPTELCVNNQDGWRGACYGDSGGPAVVRAGSNWALAGATSRSGGGRRCGEAPSVYVDVTAHRAWISQHVGGVG